MDIRKRQRITTSYIKRSEYVNGRRNQTTKYLVNSPIFSHFKEWKIVKKKLLLVRSDEQIQSTQS
jgi:hypothetical protein